MNSAGAIFIKQFQDILKNSGVLVQFVIFPVMAFLMTYVMDIDTGGAMSESFFVTMKAAMFIGMTLVGTTATAIAEDREKNSLRFLLMAGVKSHQYLLGVGGVIFACAMAVSGAFSVMMPGASFINMLTMLVSLALGAMASILLGGIIGMLSDNEQSAISISSAAGMLLGFGPMLANMSGNQTLETIFGIFYTMNFVYEDIRTTGALRSFGIILANITVLVFAFAWVYGKQESKEKGVFIVNRKVMAVLSALVLSGGGGIAFALWHNAGFVATDNARVTTTLIAIAPSAPGPLERFTIREGSHVRENEILGWVENGEAMRSPIGGLVIHTSAVQDQHVSPAEPVAVIADVNNIHILANIGESDIGRVRVGQPVTITIDTFGRQRFAGYVRNIGRITQAELGGNPVFFNISGAFTRLPHLIPVEINIVDEVDLSGIIGVNADVRISLRTPAVDLRPVTGSTADGGAAALSAATVESLTTRGTVQSVQRRMVYSTLGAVIEQVYVEAGDRVTEGQILAMLDDEDLNIQIANAQAVLRIAEVNLATAQHNHEIRRGLYGAIARDEVRQSEFALESSLAARQQAQASLDAARAAQVRAVIKAPVSGTVTAVIAREGAAGMGLLFIVEDTDNLRIAASFREYDFARIRTGMEVAISSDATGNAEYSGVISRVNPAVKALASAAGFEAEVLVTSPNTGLRIGTNARLNIRLE